MALNNVINSQDKKSHNSQILIKNHMLILEKRQEITWRNNL